MTVTWHEVTADTDIVSYRVEYKRSDESNWTAGATVAASLPRTATVTGLHSATEYNFRLRADTARRWGRSSAVTPDATAKTRPAQVTGVDAAAGTRADVLDVTWTAVARAGGYKVQWKSGSESFDSSREETVSGGTTASAILTGLTGGTSHDVRVIATLTDAPDGPPSAAATATPLPAPSSLVVSLDPALVNEGDAATGIDVTVSFNTGAGALASPTTVTVAVGGGSGQNEAAEGADYPDIADVTVTIPADATSATATDAFSIDPTEDDTSEGDETVTVRATATAAGSNIAGEAALTLEDNDIPPTTTTLALSSNSISESGGTTRLTVTLDGRTTTSVTTVAVTAQAGVFTVDETSKTIAAGQTEVEFTLTAVDNEVDAPDNTAAEVSVTMTSGANDNVLQPSPASLTFTIINDDATPEVTLVLTDDDGSIAEGETVTVTATLSHASGEDTTVTVSAAPASGARPAEAGDFTLSTNKVLTITARAKTSTGEVTIAANQDADDDAESVTVSATASNPHRADADIPSLTLTITDNDTAGVTVDTDPDTQGVQTEALALSEGHATDASKTYAVVLNTQPSGNVVIDVTSTDAGAVTVSPATLTFAPTGSTERWDQPQTVTVTAVDDADAVDETVAVTHAIDTGATDDGGYDAVSGIASVNVTVADDETVGVTVSTATLAVTEGATATYTVVLDARPTSNVVVTVTVPEGAKFTADAVRLTFTPDNWDTEQTVSVTGTGDDDASDEAAVTITHATEDGSSADEYDPVAVAGVSVSVTDDDTPGVSVDTDPGTDGAQSALAVTEGAVASYTVRLTTQPTGTVRVTPSATGANSGAVTVSGVLTFTDQNWNTEQTVTVSAVDNALADGARTVTIQNAVSGADYASVQAASVTATVADDETPPDRVVLSLDPASVTEDDATATTITVTARLETAATPATTGALATATTVSIAVAGGTASVDTDYAAIGSVPAITIAAGQLSGTTTFSIMPMNDEISEVTETVTVTGTASGGLAGTAEATLNLVDDDISARIAETAPPVLTEETLHRATLTVDLFGVAWNASVTPAQIGTSGVPGVRVDAVAGSDSQRRRLTLAYDGTDFDADATLTLSVGAGAHSGTEALTATVAVTATDEPTPGQVTGVSVSPGPGSLAVSWTAVPGADGYTVQWKGPGEDYATSRQARVAGGASTSYTIPDLAGETAYEVRVIATKAKADDGPVSADAAETTMPADAIVSASDPSPLTEANLDGARLTVDLLDARWARTVSADYFKASGIPGVSVGAVSRVSDTRARVTLAYDNTDPGTDFDVDATLALRIPAWAHRGTRAFTATIRVTAIDEPPPAQVTDVELTPGPRRIEVSWERVEGATGYRVEWTPPSPRSGLSSAPARAAWSRRTINNLAPGTEYTVRVVATRTRAPDGEPSAGQTAATPAFGATVSATAPAPLTEQTLYGAVLTVDLEGAEWVPGVHQLDYRFVPSGVPGVFVHYDGGVERVSDSRVRVRLGYRGEDFDEDATLTLKVHPETHTWTGEAAVTVAVGATDEETPGQVTGVRAAADGTLVAPAVAVSWNAVAGADGYRVQWRESSETSWNDEDTSRQRTTGATRLTITELATETAYTVRVRAIRRKAPAEGAWSADVTTRPPTTPATELTLSPSRVCEAGNPQVTATVVYEGQELGGLVGAFTVAYGSTAHSGSDYTGVSTTPRETRVRFLAGTGSVWTGRVPIGIVNDNEAEPAETIRLHFSVGHPADPAAWHPTLPHLQAVLTVVDDDGAGARPAECAARANAAATGAPSVTGTAEVGETLTAGTGDIADADGLPAASTFLWQWLRVDASTERDIAGATDAAYTPVPADVGRTLKVRARFTDRAGHAESRTSAGTAAVTDGAPQPQEAPPAVSGLPAVTGPASGDAYAAGERIAARVAFTEPVTVDASTGQPTLGLALGGARREAAYESGSGTATLTFALTAPEAAPGPARAIANGIRLNGATIRDANGTDAVLDFGTAPGVASVGIAAPPGGDGAWSAGETVEVTVTFEEPVLVNITKGRPTVGLDLGDGAERKAAYARSSGPASLMFVYSITADDPPFASVTVPANTLALSGGAIRSTAGLAAALGHDGAALAGAPVAVGEPTFDVADASARGGTGRGARLPGDADAGGVRRGGGVLGDGGRDREGLRPGLRGGLGPARLRDRARPEKTVEVKVVDDDIDEGTETMTLRLSNPSGAVLGDAEAVGTITNTDAMPRAWIARFGRTVADQVIDAVQARMETAPATGSEVRLGGHAMGGEVSPEAWEALDAACRDVWFDNRTGARDDWIAGGTGGSGTRCRYETHGMTGQELLTGSSFRFTDGSAESGFGTVWGRAAATGFDGRAGEVSLDGGS